MCRLRPLRLQSLLAAWLAAAAWTGAASPARAVELYAAGDASAEAGLDVKGFGVGVFPYAHPLMSQDPQGRGLLDMRLKLDARLGDWLHVVVHPQVLWSMASASAAPSGAGAVARLNNLPEAVPLSRTVAEGGGVSLQARLDRAALRLRMQNVDITVGRQAMSFGSTFFFTPLDVVAPFTPLVVDREYKPGIDALRLDAFTGTSTKVSLVAAYAGAWNPDGLVFAGHTRTTLWGVDVGLFAASVQRNLVLGMDASGDALGFGLRGEGTVTIPRDLHRPYARAALGADRRFENGLTVMGEVYMQTLGGERPRDYWDVARRPEFSRGEVWALGRYYAAVTGSYELSPAFTLASAFIGNLGDFSGLWAPSVTWNVAENAVLVAGGYVAVGERPGEMPSGDPARPLQLRSEFGTAPASAFVQFRLYL